LKFDFRFNLKFIVVTVVVSLIVVPIVFNYLFMWDSGLSRGETSDWFTLYGNIIGGLLGGFFTYLALLLTFKEQKETKKEEMRPRIDIPHQTIEFFDTDEKPNFKLIAIELNNIGGSIAKNIECSLSLPNYDEVLEALEKARSHFKIDPLRATTGHVDDIANGSGRRSVNLIVRDDKGNKKTSLGSVYNIYESEFIGTCIPLVLNHQAKTQYILEHNVSYWVDYIVQNRNYSAATYNEGELFNFNLEVKYSSDEYGNFIDTFNLEWEFIGMWVGGESKLKYKYVLKSTKVNSQAF
jgi:hypothetical protein